MYNNRVRNIELPENLFSNLGELKSKKIEKKEELKFVPREFDYRVSNDIKLTNYSERKEYRNRIDKMYEDIKEIIPIDNEIDNVLYFNNYVEKGIVVRPKVTSLKQFWTEYRLISNEKTDKKTQIKPKLNYSLDLKKKELDDFDELFEALSERVTEINKYIDELKEMRVNINKTSKKLEEEKEKLNNDRTQFNTYKQKEETKLNKEKETLKINFSKLQTIINDLDKKLVDIDKID